jgi:AcrR family transcriptional regulator
VPAKQSTAVPERRRVRMGVEARRQQLLELGMELFSTRAYDEVWIEEVAERAGVSRGLLYHYFPTKRDFYVAVTRSAAEEVRELTEPDPALEPAEQIRAGLDAFLRKAEERSQGFLTAYRGRLAGDPEVRAVVEEGRRRQGAKILAAVAGGQRPPQLLRVAVRGWIAFVQDVTAQWLEDKDPSRDDVRDMLVGALRGAIAAAAEVDPQVRAAIH